MKWTTCLAISVSVIAYCLTGDIRVFAPFLVLTAVWCGAVMGALLAYNRLDAEDRRHMDEAMEFQKRYDDD